MCESHVSIDEDFLLDCVLHALELFLITEDPPIVSSAYSLCLCINCCKNYQDALSQDFFFECENQNVQILLLVLIKFLHPVVFQ